MWKFNGKHASYFKILCGAEVISALDITLWESAITTPREALNLGWVELFGWFSAYSLYLAMDFWSRAITINGERGESEWERRERWYSFDCKRGRRGLRMKQRATEVWAELITVIVTPRSDTYFRAVAVFAAAVGCPNSREKNALTKEVKSLSIINKRKPASKIPLTIKRNLAH